MGIEGPDITWEEYYALHKKADEATRMSIEAQKRIDALVKLDGVYRHALFLLVGTDTASKQVFDIVWEHIYSAREEAGV